jgi:hypothetical protein
MFSILDNYNQEQFNENEQQLIQTIHDVNRYHGNGNITRAYELCMDMDYIINKIYIDSDFSVVTPIYELIFDNKMILSENDFPKLMYEIINKHVISKIDLSNNVENPHVDNLDFFNQISRSENYFELDNMNLHPKYNTDIKFNNGQSTSIEGNHKFNIINKFFDFFNNQLNKYKELILKFPENVVAENFSINLSKGFFEFYKTILYGIKEKILNNKPLDSTLQEMSYILPVYFDLFDHISRNIGTKSFRVQSEKLTKFSVNSLILFFFYKIKFHVDEYTKNDNDEKVKLFIKINDIYQNDTTEQQIKTYPLYSLEGNTLKIKQFKNDNSPNKEKSKSYEFTKSTDGAFFYNDMRGPEISTYLGISFAINNQKDVLMLSFGYSGTGKTFTMFSENGVVPNIFKNLKKDYKVVLQVTEFYGYGNLTEDVARYTPYVFYVHNFNDSLKLPNVQYKIDESITIDGQQITPMIKNSSKNIINETVNEIDKYRLINKFPDGKPKNKTITATQNNPQSSRSFMVYDFLFYDVVDPSKEPIKLSVLDLPGREDIDDNIVSQAAYKLFPTNESKEGIDEYKYGGKGDKKPEKPNRPLKKPKKDKKTLTTEYKLEEEPYNFDISLNNHIIERINSLEYNEKYKSFVDSYKNEVLVQGNTFQFKPKSTGEPVQFFRQTDHDGGGNNQPFDFRTKFTLQKDSLINATTYIDKSTKIIDTILDVSYLSNCKSVSEIIFRILQFNKSIYTFITSLTYHVSNKGYQLYKFKPKKIHLPNKLLKYSLSELFESNKTLNETISYLSISDDIITSPHFENRYNITYVDFFKKTLESIYINIQLDLISTFMKNKIDNVEISGIFSEIGNVTNKGFINPITGIDTMGSSAQENKKISSKYFDIVNWLTDPSNKYKLYLNFVILSNFNKNAFLQEAYSKNVQKIELSASESSLDNNALFPRYYNFMNKTQLILLESIMEEFSRMIKEI